MPELQVQVEEVSPVVRRLKVKVPAERVAQVVEGIYKKLGRTVRLRGYRQGHVPRHVLQKHFADEVRSDAAREVMEATFAEAVGHAGVMPVAPPALEPGKVEAGADFDYAARIEVRPEVKLQKYRGLEVKVPEHKVDEAQVTARLEQLREALSTLVPVEGREELQDGDVGNIRYEVQVTGRPSQKRDDANIRIEPGLFIEGHGGSLAGLKVGESRDLVEKFPEETGPEFQGKEAKIHVELTAIKRREVPQADDEFAKSAGAESLEDLKGKIRAELEQTAKEASERDREQALVKKLVEENPLEVPPALVGNAARRMAATLLEQATRLGLTARLGEDAVERMVEDMHPRAQQDVKRMFLLGAVADAEKIEATPEEVDAKLEKLAAAERVPVEKMRARYRSADARESLAIQLRHEKALALIESAAQITVEGPATQPPA